MSKEIKIHVPDGDLVSWGPINNTFAWESQGRKRSWQRPRDHWHGLVIALGTYKEFNSPKDRSLLATVQFSNVIGKPTTTLVPDQFRVINILADRPHSRLSLRSDPMPEDQIDKLWRKKPKMLARKSFEPIAWITYWHDWEGYDIDVREHYLASRLTLRYVFTLREVARIEVVTSGCESTPINLDDVSAIRIHAVRGGRGPVGDKEDPPPKYP